MAKGDIETYYEDGKWKNRPQGNQQASNVHNTKAPAEAKGAEMARERKVEHVIKNKDGKIGKGTGSKQTYDKDTSPPRG